MYLINKIYPKSLSQNHRIFLSALKAEVLDKKDYMLKHRFPNLEYANAVAGDLPVLAGLEIDLDDYGPVVLALLARRRVLAGHATRLVEHVRLHATRVCPYVNLESKPFGHLLHFCLPY